MSYVDCCSWARFTHKADKHESDERSVLLPLGLATHCTLAVSFRRLKRRGRRYELRHARRVSVEYVEYRSK